MRQVIPSSLLSVCADIASSRETHATLDSLFIYAGAPIESPLGSKHAKALAWLRIVNKDESLQPLSILGKIIENYMEMPLDPNNEWDQKHIHDRNKLIKTLEACDLQYLKGGKVIGSLGTPSRTLEEFIRDRDASAIDIEFTRALSTVESNPREAVSAASNILESLCKIYIHDEGLEMPLKQDLKPIWHTVRKDLGFEPRKVEDQDLQTILTGLAAVVDGIGALRTHASSAHGAGKKSYKLEPRHARLAVHSAHTLTVFILETWNKKRSPELK